jgi:hypothetical protein
MGSTVSQGKNADFRGVGESGLAAGNAGEFKAMFFMSLQSGSPPTLAVSLPSNCPATGGHFMQETGAKVLASHHFREKDARKMGTRQWL